MSVINQLTCNKGSPYTDIESHGHAATKTKAKRLLSTKSEHRLKRITN